MTEMFENCLYEVPTDCYFCKDKKKCKVYTESAHYALGMLVQDLKKAKFTLKEVNEMVTLFYYG